MLLKNVKIVLEDCVKQSDISIENGLITSLNSSSEKNDSLDLSGLYVAPGIVDLHVHGSSGFDFMDGEPSDIIMAAKGLAKNGTTTCLPTSLTCSDSELENFLCNVEEVIKDCPDFCASIEGVHLEGPFFSPLKAGAQNPEFLKEPIFKNYGKILDKHGEIVKRWSVAPELKGAMDFIDVMVKSGILVSGAHTAATYDIISQAYDHGLSMLTHFFNAMSGTLKDGKRGAVDAGLEIRDLVIELICDGIHVPIDKLDLFVKTKENKFVTACTDSMRGAGMPDGPSILGSKKDGMPVVIEEGVAKLLDRSHFAGSVATGIRLAKTLHQKVGLSLEDTFNITSLNPSRMVGLDKVTGSIKVGKRADLVVFDSQMNLKHVFLKGKRIDV